MLDFSLVHDETTHAIWIETSLMGKPLLTTPQLNKGTAFSYEERHTFGLTGKLPIQVETLAEQIKRAYGQYLSYRTNLKKNIYLNELHDRNQTLFYKLVCEHLDEMLPIIYTPIIGSAVKKFSHEFRQPRGLYIAYPEINKIDEILENRTNPHIELIVVTDGEGVLGIGDQGIGGMDIPVAKLMVYTLCGGINPLNTLPILLDVGTNNQQLLDDPLYLGWRHPRITMDEYDQFIETFIAAIQRKFPDVFLHWEDLGRANAQRYLQRFQDRVCTFNDDIQGTGIVTLAALIAAVQATNSQLIDQRIVIFGAGTAGCGIANQIYEAMLYQGLSDQQARSRFWLIDRNGLLTTNMTDLTAGQKPYARDPREIQQWRITSKRSITLADTVRNIKPTVLIGCSAKKGAFTKTIIQTMAQHIKRPIILPLSNPTEKAEATPKELLQWTNNLALIATGSPFDPIEINGKTITIAQCNNALVFPGIGLGILAIKAKRLTKKMIQAACIALSEQAPVAQDQHAPLLPILSEARHITKKIALAVAKQAIADNVATQNIDKDLTNVIDTIFWEPRYLPYRKK